MLLDFKTSFNGFFQGNKTPCLLLGPNSKSGYLLDSSICYNFQQKEATLVDTIERIIDQ